MPLNAVLHVCLAVLLYYLVNWLGAGSRTFGYNELSVYEEKQNAPAFNFLLRVLTPSIYILLVAAALYALNFDRYVRNIYLVTVYYVVIRLAINVAAGRSLLMNWRKTIGTGAATIVLATAVYFPFISRRETLLPSPRALVEGLWVVVIVYLFHLLNRVRPRYSDFPVRRRRYVIHRYRQFARRYGVLVDSLVQSVEIKALVYAIMVYEDFNRPWFFRLGERLLFPTGLVKTLGIMQVQTSRPISDRDSIRIAATKIERDNEDISRGMTQKDGWAAAGPWVMGEVARRYNPDDGYVRAVTDHWYAIYNELHRNERDSQPAASDEPNPRLD